MDKELMTIDIINGDCLELLPTLAAGSIDCMVTDPPYGISFMAKTWDKALPNPAVWRECLRVLKPGAFAAVMCAARSDCTWRLMRDLEKAGFDVGYPFIGWVYASGFPKGLDCGKAFDAEAGAEREVVGYTNTRVPKRSTNTGRYNIAGHRHEQRTDATRRGLREAPATDLARQWDGWKGGRQALKPALEPIIICQKPGKKRIIDNLRECGVGAFNCHEAAIPFEAGGNSASNPSIRLARGCRMHTTVGNGNTWRIGDKEMTVGDGRHPANLIVSDCALNDRSKFFDLDSWAERHLPAVMDVAKPSKAEKEAGCENKNHHPTCKPVALMSWLAKLLCPPGGTVLDPFLGSGTTLVAAAKLGLKGIGIEQDAGYCDIARARVRAAAEQLNLEVSA